MTKTIVINKSGSLKETDVDIGTKDNLYKKCGFKNNKNFSNKTIWQLELDDTIIYVELWASDNGKANSENKYEFPPPVDNDLYFGSCILLAYDEKSYVDLTIPMWNNIYEKLYGGFEDLDSEEEPSEDELDSIPEKDKTKTGYLKDGFVVDESEEDSDYIPGSTNSEDDDNSELCEEDYVFSDDEDNQDSEDNQDNQDNEDNEDNVDKDVIKK